jgi:hypothetical protein
MRQMTWVAAVLTAAALAACGGGGSDDDGGDQSTGLVPTPPPLGATLADDATTLRPLVPGAVWQYSGTNASGDSYENTVSHSSASPGVTETGTNTFDTGAGSVHVVAANGQILQPDPQDADGDGVADISNVVELRSPVRVNDQIVALDERIPGLVPDVDGDGQAEFFDLAIYSRVMGAEDVALEGLPTQHAVRVDHIVIGRVVLSRDGTRLPSVSSTQSIWYAENLGIVRRRLDAPSDDGLSRDVTDERLTGWSGLPG